MYVAADGMNDLQFKLLEKLLAEGAEAFPRGQATRELVGIGLELPAPRARLVTSPVRNVNLFFCFGEFLWYMAGSNDLSMISYYNKRYQQFSDDRRVLHGAYGHRWFHHCGVNQVQAVVDKLKADPSSRQAVLSIFGAQDLVTPTRDVPCTCLIQFLLREGRLHAIAYMRSNDVIWGMPYDIFSFTLLQELVARMLGCEPGTYRHWVGSLHLYQRHFELAEQIVAEQWRELAAMPPVPESDPWPDLNKVLLVERSIRAGEPWQRPALPPFWQDVVYILQAHACWRHEDARDVEELTDKVQPIYRPYLQRKGESLRAGVTYEG